MSSADDLLHHDRLRRAARQHQFLDVVDADEARRRFAAALHPQPLAAETVTLAQAHGRVLARAVLALHDAPPFDRALVDGFAVQAADLAGATDTTPARLPLNHEVLACGTVPQMAVQAGTATPIATGGIVPRGADAVVMIEHSELDDDAAAPAVLVRRAVAAGQGIDYAGSDMARGETLLQAGRVISSREVGMLAAAGHAEVAVVRRPRVAVLSTGDELVAPGTPLPPGAIHDANAAIVAAAVREHGGEPVPCGIFRDDEAALDAAVRAALATADMVVLSGGTSKGAGDVSHRILAQLGAPGIVVHGVAVKPGKPLCLAVVQGKPVVVLPGFPTSATFTFHEFVVPVLRTLAGLAPRVETEVAARLAVRVGSELGREEYVMVALVPDAQGGALAAWPVGKGSGSVTAFAQADGFVAIGALDAGLAAGAPVRVRLIGDALRVPDLNLMGSHCVGLDAVLGALAAQGVSARTLALGSLGGLAAVRRGQCDLAPAHLLDPASGRYNTPLLEAGLALVPGWRRMQGIVFRADDVRFAGGLEAIRARVLADATLLMVNRNNGSGTRVLIDRLLGDARPRGHTNQPRTHNAVAAAVAQGRADWGVAIETVARAYGLGFVPLADEHYDFFVAEARRARPAVQAFLQALAARAVRARLLALGLTPADAPAGVTLPDAGR